MVRFRKEREDVHMIAITEEVSDPPGIRIRREDTMVSEEELSEQDVLEIEKENQEAFPATIRMWGIVTLGLLVLHWVLVDFLL